MTIKALIFVALLSLPLYSFGNPIDLTQDKPKVGDSFMISKHKGETYNHIDFPRLNILVKRGGLASYNSVLNLDVVVTEVTENKDGELVIVLKRKDGKKFFNRMPTVTSNYKKALASGELKATS